MTTAAEKRYMDLVAKLPCATCGVSGVQLHHARETMGMSQRGSNYHVIPLCGSCHTGPMGIHGDRTMFRIKKWTEMDALAWVSEQIFGQLLSNKGG